MKKYWLLCGFIWSSMAFADVSIESLTNVAVAQQNADGTYSVVCTNGNREQVSAVDIRLGNVCPNDKSSIPTGVLSLQKRSDGQFDVVCRDLTRVVATVSQILNNQVCLPAPPPPPVTLRDGQYISGGHGYCQVKARYSGQTLVGLHVYFPGSRSQSEMTCKGTLCSGVFTHFPRQTFQIQVVDHMSFWWLPSRFLFRFRR